MFKVDDIELTLFDKDDISWNVINLEHGEEPNKLLNELAYYASKLVYDNRDKCNNGYVFAKVEVPGISVTEGEGSIEYSETVLYPKPVQIDSIIIYKCDGEKLVPVKSISIDKDRYVYEGTISINEDFDAIGVKTMEGLRILFREELYLPPLTATRTGTEVKESAKKVKRKRRKRKKSKSKRSRKRRRKK